MTITEFLLARIAEDEEEADWYGNTEHFEGGWTNEHTGRVLRECAAKRVIIEDTYWQPEERPTDAELHARAAHPAYEYETTEGPRKQWDNPEEPPEGEGWEPNTAMGYRDGWARLTYTEESYWRRLKPESERREWKPYVPRVLRTLAAVYFDHPDYNHAWTV